MANPFRFAATITAALLTAAPALAQSDAQDLPLPSDLPLLDYQAQLYPFIANRD